MHQRAGRGAGGRACQPDGGRELVGGAPARTAAVGQSAAGREVAGAWANRAHGHSSLHSMTYPVYYLLGRWLVQLAPRTARGRGLFLCLPPTSGSSKGPPSLVFHWLDKTIFFPSRLSIG